MSTRLSEMKLPRFPLLKDEEMRALLQKAQAGDKVARETLINCNLKLVFNLVQRFHNRGYEMEDLFQIGTIGLMKAIDKFDLSYNVKFSTYAVPLIIGEIRRFLRDDNPIKVSRFLKETAFKINREKDMLVNKLGREPSINELAETTGFSVEEIVSALEAAVSPTSIYETLYQDDGDPIYVLDHISSKVDTDENLFDSIAVKEALSILPKREKQILMLRFFDDKTQAEIAEMFGVSQVQVSRIERQALKKIRSFMSKEACAENEQNNNGGNQGGY